MRRQVAALLTAMVLVALVAVRHAQAQAETYVKGGSAIYSGVDVNIADGAHLARLHIAFEAQCMDEAAARLAVGPEAREAVVLLLRDKTYAELSTPQGKRALRQEILAALNKVLGAPRVVRVYFLQFVIG